MKCEWQGYGFGAPYQDACCSEGLVFDLDSCDEPGGPLTHTNEEACPQCRGAGEIKDGTCRVGPMALEWERAKESLIEKINGLVSDGDEDSKAVARGIIKEIEKMHEMLVERDAAARFK